MDAFEDYIPNAASVRQDLAARNLQDGPLQRWVCLAIAGRVVERRSFQDKVEVSESGYEALLGARVPEPDLEAAAPRNSRRVPEKFRAQPTVDCSSCWLERGKQLCTICGGRGMVTMGDNLRSCPACTDGYRSCDSCAGTGSAVRLSVEYIEDRARSFAHIFVPEVPFAMHSRIRRFIAESTSIPSALLVDLEQDFQSADAYRGSGEKSQIRGHRAGKALERAQHYVSRITRLQAVVAERHAAYAWPIAVASDGSVQEPACLICDAGGQTRVV